MRTHSTNRWARRHSHWAASSPIAGRMGCAFARSASPVALLSIHLQLFYTSTHMRADPLRGNQRLWVTVSPRLVPGPFAVTLIQKAPQFAAGNRPRRKPQDRKHSLLPSTPFSPPSYLPSLRPPLSCTPSAKSAVHLWKAQRPEAHHRIARHCSAAALAHRIRTMQQPHSRHLHGWVSGACL
jgi:hypothetical protein